MNQTGTSLEGVNQTGVSLGGMSQTIDSTECSGSMLFNDGVCYPSDESNLHMTTSEEVEVGEVVGGGATEGVVGGGEQSAVQETIKQL